MVFLIGALDWCLILAAAATAFAANSRIMGPVDNGTRASHTGVVPGRTLFASEFERLGGFRLKQWRLQWQPTRILTTWGANGFGGAVA